MIVKFAATMIKDKTFAKFLAVGILNTVFGYSLFAVFLFLGLHYTIAALLSTVLGVLFNFKTVGTLVFKNKENILIFRFVAVYIFAYFLNIGFLKLCTLFSVNLYFAGLALLLPLAVITFFLNKHLVFYGTAPKGSKS